jgi:hypothetical protein
MIIGQPGQDAKAAFDADTLRSFPAFYSYMFVYASNTGDLDSKKLSCLEAMMSLATFNYAHGHKNLFLDIRDTSMKMSEVMESNLPLAFGRIKIEGRKQGINQSNPANDFKLDTTSVKSKIPVPDQEEDEDTDVNENVTVQNNKKIYFGPAVARNFTLSGIVRDGKTGETLPFATVGLIGGAAGVTTNQDGFFTLLNVPTDTTTLVVQYVGYQVSEIFLTPQTQKKNLNVLIYPNSQVLNSVSITANRYDIMKVDKSLVSAVEMSPKEIEKLPNLGEPDVLRSLQLLPGVSAANESSSGLYVLGGTPDQNLVLYDGFTVYHVDHLYGFFSAFNSDALKDIQLFKGAYPADYGGRLSSVTDITAKDGNQNNFNIGGSVSLLSYNVFAELPIGKKFTSIVTFRKSYQGIIYNDLFEKLHSNGETFTPPSGGTSGGSHSFGPGGGGGFGQNQSTPTSYFYDLNGKFTYRPTDKDVISLSIYNGKDYLNNSSSFSGPNATFSASNTDLDNYGNTGGSFKWSRKWNDKIFGTTLISYSNYFNNYTQSNQSSFSDNGTTTNSSNGIYESNNLKDYSAKSDYQWDLVKGNQLQFGLFASYYSIGFDYSQNDTNTLINTQNYSSLAGAYAQDKISLFKDKLQVMPGIRTSYYNGTQQVYNEPRFSITSNVTDEITLKVGTGRFYQFVNQITQENVLTGNTDFWLLANGNELPVSSANHYIASVSYEKKDYLFSVEGYYKQLYNLTQYSLRFNPSPTEASYQEDFYTGSGYSKGLEFLAQKKSGKLTGWVSYTLSTTIDHFPIFSSIDYPASNDAPNEIHIVLMYKWRKWNFSTTWIYATGLPYTAPSGAYGITLLGGTTQYYYTVSSENSLRLPDYNRLDIGANYTLFVGSGKRRREIGYMGFSIFNVYDRQNVWYRTFSVVDGNIVQTNVNYLPIIPNVTLSVKLH